MITARCARELAFGARVLLSADIAVGITGCGGPDPEEEQPPGTIFLAVATADQVHERHHVLEADDPEDVLDGAAAIALELLAQVLGDL